MNSEPVQKILAAQNPEGWWDKPGLGYSRKYLSTVWQIIFLAEFGADIKDELVRRGCEYWLGQAQSKHGGFTHLIYCLNGNMIWALTAVAARRACVGVMPPRTIHSSSR